MSQQSNRNNDDDDDEVRAEGTVGHLWLYCFIGTAAFVWKNTEVRYGDMWNSVYLYGAQSR